MKFLLKILLAWIALCFCSELSAKKFYKYTDDKGVVHYSDKPPVTNKEVESWQVKVEDSKSKIKLVNRGSKKRPELYVVNPYHGSVQLKVRFTKRMNVLAEPELPLSLVIPALADIHVSTIEPFEKRQSWSYQYQTDFALGDPSAIHNENTVYKLPFEQHRRLVISQAFNGKYTHTGTQNAYAVDIVMPEGTPILAARSGVVMDVARDFYRGGAEDKNVFRSNYIRIVHDDGSMAVYAHLLLESVTVAPGQKITVGQKIALSGATGFVTGPHLHFVIQVNNNMQLQSVPFKFKYKNGAKTPQVGVIH
ncbi:MAG: M23 family metallopeptidase [Proteobacteria bacterium]|nr:M23 family metallopeptidase [Pseudomonadota bacterium]